MSSLGAAELAARIERCLRGVAQSAAPVPGFDPELTVRPFAEVGQQELERLTRYLMLLAEWSERVDLTAARNEDELVDLFIADASVLAATATGIQDWVDIGTGAGAPGLPLQLLRPEQRVTLVEPRGKRVAFLRTAVGVVGAEGAEVRRARAEEIDDAGFDVAVSRATFSPDGWLREGARLARRHVWVLLATSPPPTLPGWQVDAHLSYQWPLSGASRSALRFVHT